MSEQNEYIFKIDGFSPNTLPMKRLVEYIKLLADLFGNDDNVHFMRVGEGSAAQHILVDNVAQPRVEGRLLSLRTDSASHKLAGTFKSINRLLIDDATSAELVPPKTKVIKFPGKKRNKQQELGPISEVVSIQGEIVELSGRDETVSVYVRQGADIYICHTTRDTGRKLKEFLWEGKVRLSGRGKWVRTRDSVWQLDDFQVDGFEPLHDDKLTEVVANLRSIKPTLRMGSPMQVLAHLNQED
jgi:hypothetical protein